MARGKKTMQAKATNNFNKTNAKIANKQAPLGGKTGKLGQGGFVVPLASNKADTKMAPSAKKATGSVDQAKKKTKRGKK